MAIQRPADARPVAAHAFRGFNGLIGHEVVAWRHGFVEMRLEVRPELCNANGLLHGGVLMTLLDSAMTCAIQTHAGVGAGFTTVEAKTNFVRPITAGSGTIRAMGAVLHVGSRLATAEGRIVDAAGKLYAHATTTCIVMNGSVSGG